MERGENNMTTVFAEHELFDSCRVLFGSELHISRNFLEYLQRSGIKSAYRKKALETHPDVLASQSDDASAKSADLFRVVQQSYENLTTYLDARDNGFQFRILSNNPAQQPDFTRKPAKPAPRPASRSWSTADFKQSRSTKGPASGASRPHPRPTPSWQTRQPWDRVAVPSRKLLFGHFLFYAGVTNWQTIIKALVWQRTGRPRLGEIGRRFGWLTDEDILTILKKRSLYASFGSSAVALGFLTARQLQLMLFQQNRLQKKFGEYFVHHNILTPAQLNELARQFAQHNTSFDCRRYPFTARM
jgi:hypothetical protein